MRVKLALSLLSLLTPFLSAAAFFPSAQQQKSASRRFMGGGPTWDNSDYLSGLGGDEEDRQKVQDDYQGFSQRRQDLQARQEEIMKTPQGRAFLEQQNTKMETRNDSVDDTPDDPYANVQPGSGGGSRMGQMMVQAEKMKKIQEAEMMLGMEQKFAIPLDDDDDEN
jgi:hypothetical protein